MLSEEVNLANEQIGSCRDRGDGLQVSPDYSLDWQEEVVGKNLLSTVMPTTDLSNSKAPRTLPYITYLTSTKLEGILAVIAPPKSSVWLKAVVMICDYLERAVRYT